MDWEHEDVLQVPELAGFGVPIDKYKLSEQSKEEEGTAVKEDLKLERRYEQNH